jgi:hypothetical protein
MWYKYYFVIDNTFFFDYHSNRYIPYQENK